MQQTMDESSGITYEPDGLDKIKKNNNNNNVCSQPNKVKVRPAEKKY